MSISNDCSLDKINTMIDSKSLIAAQLTGIYSLVINFKFRATAITVVAAYNKYKNLNLMNRTYN